MTFKCRAHAPMHAPQFRRIDRHLTHPVAKIVHERRVKDDVSVNSVNLIRLIIQEKADPSLC